jgi:hypothetical protein
VVHTDPFGFMVLSYLTQYREMSNDNVR